MQSDQPTAAGPQTGAPDSPPDPAVGGSSDGAGATSAAPAGSETPPAPAPQPSTDPAPKPPFDGDFDAERARALIDKLRGETKAERDARLAAEQRNDSILTTIAKALGLANDEPPDPEKLSQQVRDEQRATRQARVELAVYRKAGEYGADPDALLDSRGFLDDVARLDPAAPEFSSQVGEAISAAVARNGRLKVIPPAPPAPAPPSPAPPPTPGVSGGEITGGTGAQPITEQQLARMSPDEIAKAYGEGRLAHLL